MEQEKNNFDFIAIGDIVIDAFIKLKEAHVSEGVNHEGREICMKFADKIPYESVDVINAVGNSPNAAVAAARLGLKSALISDLGADDNGQDCLDALAINKVDTRFITRHEDAKTNYHYVLWYGSERTILIKHEEYKRSLPNFGSPKWVYLSSIGEDSEQYQVELADYLEAHPEIKVAFQPGTYQIRWGTEGIMGRIYKRSEVTFCNKEEAQKILKTKETDIKKLMELMRALGSKIVVITDGPNGAYAYDGKTYWQMPLYPDPKLPVDRTGAGDAFSSTFTVALALSKTIPEALSWGPINSMSVVQAVGAQKGLLTREQLEKYLAEAPADYKPREI